MKQLPRTAQGYACVIECEHSFNACMRCVDEIGVSAENCLQPVNIANNLTQSNSVSAEVYHNLVEIADNGV